MLWPCSCLLFVSEGYVVCGFMWRIQGEQRQSIPVLCSSLWSARSIRGLWSIHGLKLETPGIALVLHPATPPGRICLRFSFMSAFPPFSFSTNWIAESLCVSRLRAFQGFATTGTSPLSKRFYTRVGTGLSHLPFSLTPLRRPGSHCWWVRWRAGWRGWDSEPIMPLTTRLWCFLFVL